MDCCEQVWTTKGDVIQCDMVLRSNFDSLELNSQRFLGWMIQMVKNSEGTR